MCRYIPWRELKGVLSFMSGQNECENKICEHTEKQKLKRWETSMMQPAAAHATGSPPLV